MLRRGHRVPGFAVAVSNGMQLASRTARRLMRPSVPLIAVLAAMTGQAFGQASVVRPNTLNYGNGRIDASIAYQYVGRTVTACARAFQGNRQVL
jgi:hypothetical protein